MKKMMYGLRKQVVEAEKALLTIIPNYLLRDFVLPVPTTVGLERLEVLASKRGTLLQWNIAKISLDLLCHGPIDEKRNHHHGSLNTMTAERNVHDTQVIHSSISCTHCPL